MKEIKILAIGNSFSRDATCYLHQIAKAAGVETRVVNLYIGGCPLERHWQNIEKKQERYQYQINGQVTDRYVTIDEVLLAENWDFIVTQQASHDSGWKDTYEPFLGLMKDYIREKTPQASFVLHQTWAYELDSDHGNFARYHRSQQEMYTRSKSCYEEMAQKYDLPLIPCGDVIQALRKLEPFQYENGGLSLCRDGFHMSFLYGRYALACTWAKKLLGITLRENTYVPVDMSVEENADETLLTLIRNTVDAMSM